MTTVAITLAGGVELKADLLDIAAIPCMQADIAALKAATLAGMDAIIALVGAHPEITNWPEWDACSRFVHDHSALVATPEGVGRVEP